MPFRRLPNTLPAVIRTLTTAREAWKNTPVAGDRLISAEQWAQLDDTDPTSPLSILLAEVSERDTALANQAPLTSQASQDAARLTLFCSHFHQVLDFAIARRDLPRGSRTFYGRDIDAASIPKMSTYAELADVAAKVALGETARQTAQGAAFVPMANPSAANVAAVYAVFQPARAQSDQAQAATNTEEEAVTALYPAAHELAVDICDTVEFNVRKDPSASSRRAKARVWGVVYQNEDGSLAPPDPVPPGPQPPPPPAA